MAMTDTMQFWLTISFLVLAAVVILLTVFSHAHLAQEGGPKKFWVRGWYALGYALAVLIVIVGLGVVINTSEIGLDPRALINVLVVATSAVCILLTFAMVAFFKGRK